MNRSSPYMGRGGQGVPVDRHCVPPCCTAAELLTNPARPALNPPTVSSLPTWFSVGERRQVQPTACLTEQVIYSGLMDGLVSRKPPTRPVGAEALVVRCVEREIAEGGLGPGSRLPTERDWVARSGQSRSVVRRALGVLEAEGRIIRHVGRGTFLAPEPSEGGRGYATPSGSSPADIMSVRLLVEPATMALVVTAATADDYVEMERCLRGGERNRGFEEFEHWDAAFHRSLARATHNTFLVGICDMLNIARDQPTWGQLKRRNFTAERRQSYVEDHRAIAAALVDRDAQTAQEAMRRHLIRVRDNILGSPV